MVQIGSVWIPGPRLNRLNKPRKVIRPHAFDPHLVYTRMAMGDGADAASGKVELFNVEFLVENYLPLGELGDEGAPAT
jgi:hypothetical protein